MLTFILAIAIGTILGSIVPTGVSGEKYSAPTEADFEELLRRRGLK
ncbi:hypothetical protein ACFDR9_002797 [Janthinobacterium sp. CG_23.3]